MQSIESTNGAILPLAPDTFQSTGIQVTGTLPRRFHRLKSRGCVWKASIAGWFSGQPPRVVLWLGFALGIGLRSGCPIRWAPALEAWEKTAGPIRRGAPKAEPPAACFWWGDDEPGPGTTITGHLAPSNSVPAGLGKATPGPARDTVASAANPKP